MYESLLHLLRASLPEFLGSLMAATVLTIVGWSVKSIRDRRRVRRTRDDTPQLGAPATDTDRSSAAWARLPPLGSTGANFPGSP